MRAVARFAIAALFAALSEAQNGFNSSTPLQYLNSTSALHTNATTSFVHANTSNPSHATALPSFNSSAHVWVNSSVTIAKNYSPPTNQTTFAPPTNISLSHATTPPYPINTTRLSTNGTVNRANSTSLNATSIAHYSNSTYPTVLPTSILYPNVTSNRTKDPCQAAFESREAAYWDWTPTTSITWTTVLTEAWDVVTSSTEIFECTSTCGTICYAGNVTTMRYTSRHDKTQTRTYTEPPPFPTPLPNCTIPYDACIELQSSYTSATNFFEAQGPEYWATERDPERPYCSACSSTACTFNGMFAMSLYYWPATTPVSRDYCATSPTTGWASDYEPDVDHTYIPTTTGPYAVVDNITMYQGNVYISYQEPRVMDNCGHEVTRRDPGENRVITVASEALHSIRTFPALLAPWPVTWDLKPYPVNFADFDEPVPWSAYVGQQDCAQWGETEYKCIAVKPHNYFPHMIMPPQIRGLDSAWANCKYDEFAAFDPPVALRPANMFSSSVVVAKPTTYTNIVLETTPATPAQHGGGWMPVITPQPTKPQNPEVGDGIDQPPVAQPPPNQVPNMPHPTQGPNPVAPVELPREGITVGPSLMPVDPSGGLIVQPGVVLKPGDPATTFDGTTMSIGPSGIVVIDKQGTSTLPLPATQPVQQSITIGTSVLPIDSAGNVIIKPGVTLTFRGVALKVDGTSMSLGSVGMIVIDGRGTSTISMPTPKPPQSVITIGSSTYSLDKAGGIILRPGEVLQPGAPALTISGTTYSIGPSGLIIIDNKGTTTVPITAAGKQYITVGSQTYTLVNGKLILNPKLTLTGPGGMVIFQGTTVMLRSESVVVESQGSTRAITIKSKIMPTKTGSAGSAENGGAGKSRKSGADIHGPNRATAVVAVLVAFGQALYYMV